MAAGMSCTLSAASCQKRIGNDLLSVCMPCYDHLTVDGDYPDEICAVRDDRRDKGDVLYPDMPVISADRGTHEIRYAQVALLSPVAHDIRKA